MIDGDNAQAALLPQMLAEVSKYGVMIIRRVYGDWTTTQLKSWKEVLHTYALKPEQQFSYTTGKNATDSALIIDAMDIIYTTDVDGVCIVSSDSDYTRLATRIREKNLFVMGIGRNSTPRAFVNACDVFVYTENLQSVADDSAIEPSTASEDIPVPVIGTATNPTPSLEQLFRTAFDTTVQDDGWAHLGTLGSTLRQLDPGFDPRTYGHRQLLQLVKAHPKIIEVKNASSSGNMPNYYVRMKVKS